ncbi:hypothetical protein [Streptomyces cahuitamycinicus]|uniref:Uncharacterized protein n=1 Tax=Streptomyces cahuitamycinicus TaxID=2070367 RepID=A0A2N8TC20_9ACTN|nr:hypothetical protein [Streptomyces cahuitamycinicus]PNG16494.1 hypothetical protein C1J00_41630 [Streptomyces cahuitamycinicus]
MNAEMDRAEQRVNLTKEPGTYFVIVDDEEVYDWPVWKTGEELKRYVVEVQRAADSEVERYVQREDLTAACDDSQSPLKFRTYQAVSHGHAAALAMREFAEQMAFEELTDVFYADELAFTGAGFGDSSS